MATGLRSEIGRGRGGEQKSNIRTYGREKILVFVFHMAKHCTMSLFYHNKKSQSLSFTGYFVVNKAFHRSVRTSTPNPITPIATLLNSKKVLRLWKGKYLSSPISTLLLEKKIKLFLSFPSLVIVTRVFSVIFLNILRICV